MNTPQLLESLPQRRFDQGSNAQQTHCRVLYLTSDLVGGTGNHLVNMSRLLDKKVFQLEILGLPNCTARCVPEIPITVFQHNGRFHRYPFTQLRSLQFVRRYLRSHQIDVVHAYFFWPIIYGRILKLAGVIGHLVENREDQGFNWGYHEYALLRMTRHAPDVVICVADAVRETVLRRERLDPARVCVVHNGVNLGVPANNDPGVVRRNLGFADDAPLVGMVANLDRAVKGGGYFIQAIPEIVRVVPRARFVIVGEADEYNLRRQARALGVDQFVVFAGVQTNVDDFYGAFDVSVLTSLSEGLSITILESMIHGVPVVATDVGGNREIVIDGDTGFLVPPRSPREFAAKVVAVLTQPELRARFGHAAQTRIQRHFALQYVSDRYAALYQRVCGM